MLLIILMWSGNTIAIAITVLFVSILVFFALRSKKKKIAEPEPEKESLPLGPGDYKQPDRFEDNLYQSLMNPKLQIREIRVFRDRTEDKDKLVFASSLSFNFNAEDKATLVALIPELTEVSVRNSHELILAKSPAASFADLNNGILTHLFTYLNRKYDWMNKKITVSFHYVFSGENLNCHLPLLTVNHVRLGILIDNIPGIIHNLNAADRMNRIATYQFDINKEASAKWVDLLPKIQEVFRQYFTGGIEFIGPN
jgi:hypothetical protein